MPAVATHGTEFIIDRYLSSITYLSVERIAPDGTRTVAATVALLERERLALVDALTRVPCESSTVVPVI